MSVRPEQGRLHLAAPQDIAFDPNGLADVSAVMQSGLAVFPLQCCWWLGGVVSSFTTLMGSGTPIRAFGQRRRTVGLTWPR